MKKLFALLLAVAMLAVPLTACKKNKPEPAESSSSQPAATYTYHDGEYAVTYAVAAIDRTLDYLTLSVEKDQLTIKEYGCREEAAPVASDMSSDAAASVAASSEAVAADAASASSEITEYQAKALEAMKEIQAEWEATGKNVDQMEVVEGAEEHFYRFQRMMRTALKFAEAGDTTPVILGKYADGDYNAEMPSFDDDGWKSYIKLTVKDGLLKTIDFDAIQQEDETSLITKDATLNPAGGSNTPSVYYPAIAKSFLEAGENISNISAPAGGADAFKAFGKMINALLPQMISGGKTSVIAPLYVNGTYKAQYKDFDVYGWKDYVTLQIRDDQVTIKEFDAFSKTDETKLKSADTELMTKWSDAVGRSPDALIEELYKNFAASKNDVLKVENVAGATVSTNDFKLLVGQILATAALEGDSSTTLEVASVAWQKATA